MKWYLAGVGAPALAAFVVATWRDRLYFEQNPFQAMALLLTLVVVPIACAWFMAEIVEFVRPRRAFAPNGKRSRIAPLVLGLVVGLLTIGSTALLLPALKGAVHDVVVTGGCASILSAIAIFVLPRNRPGRCTACGYDLGGLTSGTCPECGCDARLTRAFA